MSQIGGYEILERIGQGGMGTVYRARAPDGTYVALKLLHLNLCGLDEYDRRFHRETKLAEKMAHPNVMRVLADGEDDGQHYLVMEFVEGRTLAELVHETCEATPSRSTFPGSRPPRRMRQAFAYTWARTGRICYTRGSCYKCRT